MASHASKLGIIGIIAAMMFATACSSKDAQSDSNGTNGSTDPNKPAELSMVFKSSATIKFSEGENYDDNSVKKAYEEAANVKINYDWIIDEKEYDNKVRVTIASGDIPDVMWVRMPEFQQLLKADMLMDLTNAWDQNASSRAKEFVMTDGGAQMKSATFDGKLMAIPQTGSPYDDASVVWIRTDWLKKLSLPEPKSMQDLLQIADAFVKQDPDGNGKDDTYGLAISKGIYGGIYDLIGFFNGYHAYPQTWIKDDSGQLVYGSIQPEMKAALQQLQDMFKNGLIDKEFGAKEAPKVNELMANNQLGIGFGKWWLPAYPLKPAVVVDNEVTQEWKPFAIPSIDDKPALKQSNLGVGGYYVVSKNAKNPEAAIRLASLMIEASDHEGEGDPKWDPFIEAPTAEGADYWKLTPIVLFKQDFNAKQGELLPAALESKDPSSLPHPLMKKVYDRVMQYRDGDANNWNEEKQVEALQVEAGYVERNEYMKNEFYGGSTKTMTEKNAILDAKEQELITKIILNAASVDEFDEFVKQWRSLGGDAITKEVNDWYKEVNQ
jgi:putative aldouronate transport system substrate-binding protein